MESVESALWAAVAANNPVRFGKAIALDPDLCRSWVRSSSPDRPPLSMPLLSLLVMERRTALAELLLAVDGSGAVLRNEVVDVDCRDSAGYTALHRAVGNGDRAAVAALLRHEPRYRVLRNHLLTPGAPPVPITSREVLSLLDEHTASSRCQQPHDRCSMM